MENTFDAFNFDAMAAEIGDPFKQASNKYASDERFYKLTKDKDGNGAALIRFLPDSEKRMILPVNKINTTIIKNSKKRFVNELSPTNIGQPCPFQEKWSELYNAGLKDPVKDANGNITQIGSKLFNRAQRYYANIKVINDPANPENNGKIFLLDMSGSMNSKLEKALKVSETDIALGKKPKQLFNPLQGHNFTIVSQKGSNGIINYDASEVSPEITNLYQNAEGTLTPEQTMQAALTDIKENTYKLSEFLDPASYMSYDELVQKMKWVMWEDVKAQPASVTTPGVQDTPVEVATQVNIPEVQPVQRAEVAEVQTPAQPVQQAQATPAANTDLDSLLAGLS